MVSEGLNIFRDKTHPSLAGHTLIKSKIREDTGCSVSSLSAAGNNCGSTLIPISAWLPATG